VYKVLERLRAAKTSFAETTERAAAIALDLRRDSDFVRVRAQLDMLAEQVPQLREA
jgi:acyl carrier protein phosphodiesterase